MKGSREMHKLVVCIRFLISLNAWVPGLHFFILLTGWWKPLLTLTLCGTICPLGVGLKKWPFDGFATVKSTTNNTWCTTVFWPFWVKLTLTLTVLYCTVEDRIFFRQFWLTSVIQTAMMSRVHGEFKPLYKSLHHCPPFRPPLRSYQGR